MKYCKQTRQNSAKKAARTRKARDAFYTKYGDTTYHIVERLIRNGTTQDTKDILSLVSGISRSSIAAYQANLNRPGVFRRMAEACNF